MCFSIAWFLQLLITLVVLCGVIALMRIWVIPLLAATDARIAATINVIIWVAVAIFVIWVCGELLVCAFSYGDSASMADPIDIIAKTLWGEARGCGIAGMRNVASVIANRVKRPGWWGHDFISVCQAPYQFSCWNADDPNRAKMDAITTADPWFLMARSVAQTIVAGSLVDQTGGADSYYARTIATPPAWAAKARHVYSDGWHSFYITERTPPAQPTPVGSAADTLNDQELDHLDELDEGPST